MLSPVHNRAFVSPTFKLPAHHLGYNLPDINSKFYAMSTQLQRMTTRAKNANQHPSYVQTKLHKLSAPADEPKVKKVAAEAAKLAKATTKEVSTACGARCYGEGKHA